jgi:hypothetical protein
VPSLYPDNMTKTEATANGFFSDTLTGVFQGTTASEDEITIQSAFVSGTHNPSEVNNDERPDIDAIKKVYEHLGFDVSNMSVTELLGTPLLIHKKYMPNGIVDFVELFDKVNGTFFGRKDLPKVGYQEQIKISAEREARLEPSTIEIDEELIASADQLQDPTDASKLLYKLVADKVIKLAGEDNTIDETVFGSEAAPLIRHARLLKSKGFDDGARYILQKAREVAIVTMCGIGGKSDQNLLGEDQQTLKEDGEINLENVENMNGNIRCYKCREKVPKRKVVKKSRGTWCCPKCHYEVDVCTGSIKNEGIPTKKISLTKILAPAA